MAPPHPSSPFQRRTNPVGVSPLVDFFTDRVAVYVYRRREGLEFLQLRRAEGGYEGTWQIVYGGIQEGETALKAARRELLEETGNKPVKVWQVETLEQFFSVPNDRIEILPVFAVELAPDAEVKLNEEHDDFRWMPVEQLDLTWRSQRETVKVLLEQLERGGPALELLTY